MLLAAIIATLSALVFWALFFALAYAILYGSLVLSYLFVWDAKTKAQICPRGLWRSIFDD